MANSIQFTVALAVAMAFTQAQAATVAELKSTIDAYGLTATITQNDAGQSDVVTVTGSKSGVTTPLILDIGFGLAVMWNADLSGNVGGDGSIVSPAEPTGPLCLVCNSGTGTLHVQSGTINNNGIGGAAIYNISTGKVSIEGGTLLSTSFELTDNVVVSNALSKSGALNLSGAPTITGRIMVMKDNPISVDVAFAPGEKIYKLHYNDYSAGMTLVKGGGNFPSNFELVNNRTGLTPVTSGKDLILPGGSSSSTTPSSSSNAPSSSSTTQSSSSDSPVPILTGKTITLENLPKNTKIEIYNLQGKLIYSAYPENPKILRIGVQTKGIYIVKINNTRTVKMAVM